MAAHEEFDLYRIAGRRDRPLLRYGHFLRDAVIGEDDAVLEQTQPNLAGRLGGQVGEEEGDAGRTGAWAAISSTILMSASGP